MKIAQIAPPWFAVPPTGYGGIELVVALLADGLAERGHDVTLFASGGSRDEGQRSCRRCRPAGSRAARQRLVRRVSRRCRRTSTIGDDFDVVHDHSGIVGPAMGALLRGSPPVVHTLHGPWTEPSRRASTRCSHEHVHLVAISETQRADNPDVRYAGVVHNGIDLDDYPFRDEKDDFLVYIGRANPDKGPSLAIEVARRAGPAARDGRQEERAVRARLLGRDRRSAAQRRGRGVRGDLPRAEGRPARHGRARWCSRSSGPSRSGS